MQARLNRPGAAHGAPTVLPLKTFSLGRYREMRASNPPAADARGKYLFGRFAVVHSPFHDLGQAVFRGESLLGTPRQSRPRRVTAAAARISVRPRRLARPSGNPSPVRPYTRQGFGAAAGRRWEMGDRRWEIGDGRYPGAGIGISLGGAREEDRARLRR